MSQWKIRKKIKFNKNGHQTRSAYLHKSIILDNRITGNQTIHHTHQVASVSRINNARAVGKTQRSFGNRRPGDKVALTIREKDGSEVVKELVLKNKDGETKLISKEEISKNQALGATFVELSSKEKKELNITYGVKISSINAGKLKSIGLTEGMVIVKVNNEAVESVEQLTTKLNGVNKGVLLEVLTETGKKEYYGFGL